MKKDTYVTTPEDRILQTEYSDVMKKSFIDYAMSVIVARALPDVRDGLKPVQRRHCYIPRSFVYKLGHEPEKQREQKI